MSDTTAAERLPVLERFKVPVFLVLALALLAGIAVLLWQRPAPTTITVLPPLPTAIPSATPTPGPYTVYVTGEVRHPETLVTVPAGSRVQDAIHAAGGATGRADLSRVNLGQLLNDGDQVNVPARGASADATPTANHPPLVHINSATAAEIEQLPGIGPSLAQAIVDYRTEHGPFYTIEDLDYVPGMGPSKLEAIREWVVFD